MTLRHADAPEEEFDPSVALGMGANRAYLASVVCQQSLIYGRGLHSSTSQLNLSRFINKIHPKYPLLPHNTT